MVAGKSVAGEPARVSGRSTSGVRLILYNVGDASSTSRVSEDGGRDGAVKRLAVSTGPLSVSPHVHVRPIDPVVFREPSSKRRET